MKFSVFALVSFALSSPALAHAGDHQHFDLLAALKHLVSEPFHVALVVAAVAAAFLVMRLRRRQVVKMKAVGKG